MDSVFDFSDKEKGPEIIGVQLRDGEERKKERPALFFSPQYGSTNENGTIITRGSPEGLARNKRPLKWDLPLTQSVDGHRKLGTKEKNIKTRESGATTKKLKISKEEKTKKNRRTSGSGGDSGSGEEGGVVRRLSGPEQRQLSEGILHLGKQDKVQHSPEVSPSFHVSFRPQSTSPPPSLSEPPSKRSFFPKKSLSLLSCSPKPSLSIKKVGSPPPTSPNARGLLPPFSETRDPPSHSKSPSRHSAPANSDESPSLKSFGRTRSTNSTRTLFIDKRQRKSRGRPKTTSFSPTTTKLSPRSPHSPHSPQFPNASIPSSPDQGSKVCGFLDILIDSGSGPIHQQMCCTVLRGNGSDGGFFSTKFGKRSQKWEWNESCTFVVNDLTQPFQIQLYSIAFGLNSLVGTADLKWEDLEEQPQTYRLSLISPSGKSSKYRVNLQAQFSSSPNEGFLAHLGSPIPSFPQRLRTGDIVLIESNPIFSKDPFNRLLSDRGWDHVAVVYCQEGGEVLLFEALLEFGVILNNAARRLRKVLQGGGSIGVRHLSSTWQGSRDLLTCKTASYVQSMLGESFQLQMTRYLKSGLVLQAPPPSDEKSWFCSQAILAYYQEMNILNSKNIRPTGFFPKDFALENIELQGRYSLSEIHLCSHPPSWVDIIANQ